MMKYENRPIFVAFQRHKKTKRYKKIILSQNIIGHQVRYVYATWHYSYLSLNDDIKEKYSNPEMNEFLDDVYKDMLDNLNLFREKADEQAATPVPMGPRQGARTDPFRKYQINVLVDNSETKGRPVVIETSPTYRNLF